MNASQAMVSAVFGFGVLLTLSVIVAAAADPEYELVSRQLHHWATKTQTQSQVLLLVNYRETLIGCDSFDEFLSPFFHTMIVLPEDVGDLLEVDKLMDEPRNTAGLHIFYTEEGAMGGNHRAYKIADQFVSSELEPRGIDIRYVHSNNCDVHQFSEGHSRFVPFEQLVLRMERDFNLVQQYRNVGAGKALVTNYDSEGFPPKCYKNCNAYHPFSDMKVFAMNAILFEDVPIEMNSTEFGTLHGNDFEDWWDRGAKGFQYKPSSLANACLPWLIDTSWVFEDHSFMFDLEAFRTVKDQFFAVSSTSIPDEKNFIGRFAQLHNFTLVRHNDVAFHLNFGHYARFLNYPESLDVDKFRMRNLEEVVNHRNPKAQQGNWDRIRDFTGIMTSHNAWTTFLFRNFRRNTWLPDSISNAMITVSDPTVFKIVQLVLWYCGYAYKGEVDGVLQFEIEAVYPGTRLVSFQSKPNGANRKTLTFRYADGQSYSLYVDSFQTGPPPDGTKDYLEIPADATINRNGIHFRN